MSLPKGPYNPNKEEPEILKFWLENNFYSPEFKSKNFLSTSVDENRETFCIILPPPNANGNLHLGHMSGYAYQDLMGRYKRMRGKKVLLLPGKDHAGIQTEVVFERELKKKGKTKNDLGRQSFYNGCYKFCMKNSKIARSQEQMIGLSADFDRELFTLDPRIVDEILKSFIQLYDDGLIYRGKRLINWCVRCQSALSDIDTEFKDAVSPFVYFKYAFTKTEPEAVEIKNTFIGKTIDWTYERSKTSKDDKFPGALGTYDEFTKIDDKPLGIQGIGYDPKLKKDTVVKGKAVGINMRLDKKFRLIVVNPEFNGDLDKELERIFYFELKHAAGSHIIKLDEYPDDKYYTNGFVMGTVRPETKFGDTAIAVDPKDERYSEIAGKEFEVVTLNGTTKLKVIADEAVDKDFGSGAVKITPAHAPEDWDIAQRHKEDTMPEKQVINFDGTLNHLTGKYEGLEASKAREKMYADMKENGMLVHIDKNYKNRIRICERCKHPIEPLVSHQWFVDTKPLKKKARELVENSITEIMPEGNKRTYIDWMNTPEDWCITRQLWWGYRVPVWYKGIKEQYISKTGEVKEKIAGNMIETKDDYAKVMKVTTKDPNTNSTKSKPKLILIPGKHGCAQNEIYPALQKLYPNSVDVKIKDIGNPKISDYEDAFRKVDFDKTDVLVAHSLGTRAIARYILDNKLQVDTLVLFAAAACEPREKDKNSPYIDLWDDNDRYLELSKYVNELYIVYSDDDEISTLDEFERFIKLFKDPITTLEKGKKHYASKEYSYTSERILEILKSKLSTKQLWHQDEDVLDTWFSSGQWPYVTLKAKKGDFEDYYPTQVMETGWDILLFWVTRMMLLNPYRAMKDGKKDEQSQIPFKNVYLHGLVLDEKGIKMSKSRGNGIDPFEMMKKFGTDALRFSFVVGNKVGQNYRLYEEKIASYRNFCNKLWNAGKFVLMNIDKAADTLPAINKKDLKLTKEDDKFLKHIEVLIQDTNRRLEKFQFGIAASELYESFWHTFADAYIETIKPRLYEKDKEGNPINQSPNEKESKLAAQWCATYALETYLKLLHPFIPYITEGIWQELPKREGESETIMYASWPT